MTGRVGHYELRHSIARGGMGVVYQAVHQSTGAIVALKTVTLPDAGLLGSIRREIHALSRLRHPGIVRILDHGSHEGTPWYAMELHEGSTLGRLRHGPGAGSSAAQRASTHPLGSGNAMPSRDDAGATTTDPLGSPEALPRVLALVRRLCHPIRYMHGEGLVHRDLKPENVIVRPDGAVVIVDFGLAWRFGSVDARDVVAAHAEVAGTIGYIAPEQLCGEDVDARADLYALGCILYLLATGRPVFPTDDRMSCVRCHLEDEPEPPSYHAPHLPRELDHLVLSLLAKEPRRRPGYADDVARALAKLGASGDDDAPARTYLYRPGIAGRDAEIAALDRALAEAGGGKSRMALVTGASGVGKTRLVLELVRLAGLRGFPTFTGGCQVDALAPLLSLRPVLQQLGDRCRGLGQAETDRVFGRRAKVLAAYEPSLRCLPGVECHPEPVELAGDEGRLRVVSDLATTLLAVAERHGGLLVLDDLQWADELTFELLAHLCRTARSGGSRLLVVGTCRREEPRAELEELARREDATVIDLDRLDPGAVARMVQDMLALAEPHDALATLIDGQAEGNPFFVAQYLRAGVDVGLLERDSQGTWRLGSATAGLPLPRGVVDLVQHHLVRLDDGERRILEAAAVLGRAARHDLLPVVAGVDEDTAFAAVSGLLRRCLLVDQGASARFDHDKIAEVVRSALIGEERRVLHERAAHALQALPEPERAEWLGEIGRHFRSAGHVKRARGYLLDGARVASRRYAHDEAEQLLREHLELWTAPTAESVSARVALAVSVLALAGRLADAQRELQTALEEARQCGDGAREGDCLRELGVVHRRRGSFEQAEAWARQALARARAQGDRGREGSALNLLAAIAFDADRIDDGDALDRQALDIYLERGDQASAGEILGNLGNIRVTQERLAEGRDLFRRALEMLRATGHRSGEAVVLSNVVSLELREDRIEEARKPCEEALRITREIGDRRNEGYVVVKLALVHQRLGRPEQAVELLAQAIALARAIGDRRLESLAVMHVAADQMRRGRLADALTTYDEAMAAARDAGDRWAEAEALSSIASVHRTRGDEELADTYAERARTVVRLLTPSREAPSAGSSSP